MTQAQLYSDRLKALHPGKEVMLYPVSFVDVDGGMLALARIDAAKRLVIAARDDLGFETDERLPGDPPLKLGPVSPHNADRLRQLCPWTAPRPVGLETSFGAGDRLGLATPGHIRALSGYDIVPVLAQQSIREMTRTGRTAQQVMDDVTWAVLQEGYRCGFGSDADHLKTEGDIRSTVEAGYTGFTLDPSDHINNRARTLSDDEAARAWTQLFETEQEAAGFLRRYCGSVHEVKSAGGTLKLEIGEIELHRLAVELLPAIRHTIHGYRLIKSLKGDEPFDFEMSVDETESPTTAKAHYLVASELGRAGVRLTALAPRFVGEFQKAIDYIGDLSAFRGQMRDHVILAHHFGPYKLSVHSGSDKYSIFPIVAEESGGLYHEKTAGTSYLEALRVVCRTDAALFREIARFALEKFEGERHSYHVTTDLTRVPDPDRLDDDGLESMLDLDDSRQVLHITFGATLTSKSHDGNYRFRDRIFELLGRHEEEYIRVLVVLFRRHLDAFGVKKSL